jgi:hypothetical protein
LSARNPFTKDGERHSATIRLHENSLEHESERGAKEEKGEIRSALEKNYAGMKGKGP